MARVITKLSPIAAKALHNSVSMIEFKNSSTDGVNVHAYATAEYDNLKPVIKTDKSFSIAFDLKQLLDISAGGSFKLAGTNARGWTLTIFKASNNTIYELRFKFNHGSSASANKEYRFIVSSQAPRKAQFIFCYDHTGQMTGFDPVLQPVTKPGLGMLYMNGRPITGVLSAGQTYSDASVNTSLNSVTHLFFNSTGWDGSVDNRFLLNHFIVFDRLVSVTEVREMWQYNNWVPPTLYANCFCHYTTATSGATIPDGVEDYNFTKGVLLVAKPATIIGYTNAELGVPDPETQVAYKDYYTEVAL